MNLQLFAEGDGAGAGAGAAAEPKTFDDVLKDTKHQAEFDRRIQKALEKQKSRLDVLYSDKASEAEKLAQMTKEEKAVYLQKQKEQEIADRENKLTKREMLAEAKSLLADKKIPSTLADFLNYKDADACKQSVDALAKVWQEALQAAIEDKLKGGKPPKKAPGEEPATSETFAKMGYAERLKLKTENPELYKQLSGK